MAAGRWQDALDAIDVSFAEQTPEVLTARGHLLLELRRTAESLACFEHALAERPALGPARVGRARALLRLGRAAAAESSMHELLREQPDHAAAHATLGAIALAQGRFDAAWQ